MRCVSLVVSARVPPAGESFPLISTSGGFPGEKNKSLILAEVRSIAASKSGVEIGAGAEAAAAAPATAAPAGFAATVFATAALAATTLPATADVGLKTGFAAGAGVGVAVEAADATPTFGNGFPGVDIRQNLSAPLEWIGAESRVMQHRARAYVSLVQQPMGTVPPVNSPESDS
jgi:hypothetical protein